MESVSLLEEIVTKVTADLPPAHGQQQPAAAAPEVRVGDGPLNVISANAEQMFLDILRTGQTARLPRYKGDLELINHSAGSISSGPSPSCPSRPRAACAG